MAERTGAGGLVGQLWATHRALVIGVGVTLVAALVAVGVLVTRSNGDGDAPISPEESRRRLTEALNTGSAPPAEDQPSAARPAAATAALTSLVERGNQRGYYARYEITDGSAGAPSLLEVWRRPPLLRQMTTVRSGTSEARNQVFVQPSGVVSCASAGATAWVCQPRPDLRPGAADPFTLPDPALLAARAITERDDRVAGRAVRCFNLGGDPVGELCLTPEGIPVRLTVGQNRLDLRELTDASPPDSAFVVPS